MLENPILSCTQCGAAFIDPAEEEIIDLTVYFCPRCGVHHDHINVYTPALEATLFWEGIEQNYERREIVQLKMLADRCMGLSDSQ